MHDTGTPLGATWDGRGTTFAVRSTPAERVELCLFDPAEPDAGEQRVELARGAADVWSGRVSSTPGMAGMAGMDGILAVPGTRYGYRVHGPWEPARGLRCNPAKLLVDPYARWVAGDLTLHPAIFGHDLEEPRRPDSRDSASYVPRSVVVDPTFGWGDDRAPRVPWSDTVVYEAHVKGLTRRHPDVPEQLRGTYRGLAHPAVLDHLTGLGVTTVELLPVHAFAPEVHLLRKGLPNYWGYSTLGFLAPHAAYAFPGTDPVREFKEMVRALHAAGLEVVLDVVYNHTCEGGADGPTLSLRGLDEAAFYRMRDDGSHVDHTGCGNTLDLRSTQARQLVLDSLRYWVQEMHVDGFRFDLAPALGREPENFNPRAAFFTEVAADPVLSRVKLVAEPWDLGPGGWQTGGFPAPWTEWNDRFRDDVRDYWRGWSHGVRGVANRLLGSPDVFAGRAPLASVNFVTSHDGFTACDLVSYDRKHNDANGESGCDGTDHNHSWNHGVEGETRDPEVLAAREQTVRNLLATLLLARGVPMLTAGDELGRTQSGNNNAYCQDNVTSWVDWDFAPWQRDLLATVRRLLVLRATHPALRGVPAYVGQPPGPPALRPPQDHAQFVARALRPDGREMTDRDWHDPALRTAVVHWESSGGAGGIDVVLIALHAGAEPSWVVLPHTQHAYDVQLDTRSASPAAGSPYRVGAGRRLELAPRSLVLLTAVSAC